MDETQAGQAQPDLDAQRDVKCVPIARAILNDLAVGLFPENGTMDYPALTKQGLERLLEADANVTMEVPYVYQLMLAGLTGLHVAIQAAEPAPMDDARYSRIARQLISILATANITLTAKTPDEAEYAPVKEQVATLIASEKLTRIEVSYIVDNLFAAFNTAQNYAQMTLEQAMKKAEEKLFAIDDMTSLTMKKLDEVLKS
jgi:hypothetical protein